MTGLRINGRSKGEKEKGKKTVKDGKRGEVL